jgi:hypothetical protein
MNLYHSQLLTDVAQGLLQAAWKRENDNLAKKRDEKTSGREATSALNDVCTISLISAYNVTMTKYHASLCFVYQVVTSAPPQHVLLHALLPSWVWLAYFMLNVLQRPFVTCEFRTLACMACMLHCVHY